MIDMLYLRSTGFFSTQAHTGEKNCYPSFSVPLQQTYFAAGEKNFFIIYLVKNSFTTTSANLTNHKKLPFYI